MTDDIVKHLQDTAWCKHYNDGGNNPSGKLMEEAAEEITRLRAENEKLRKALEPFAEKYQDNGLTHSMYIFEMKHLLAAKKLLGETDE